MQKIFFSILILSFLIVGTGVLAQNDELPSPGITPDSPFYFLERIVEEISTFFIFGDLKKAERHALLAAERLAEAQAIAEKGKPELIEKTSARYENQLEKSMARIERAIRKGENTEKIMEVLDRVGQATSKHLEVLAEVYEKAPEQAKPAVENAMKVSVKRHEKAVEVLKAKNALVKKFGDPKVKQVIADLTVTMRENQLIGMAAPQIGENYQMFVTEPRKTAFRSGATDMLRVYINPKIIHFSSETTVIYEGCGSVLNGQLFGYGGACMSFYYLYIGHSLKSDDCCKECKQDL